MSTLTTAAADAYQDHLADQAVAARTTLGTVLAPWDPKAAEVVDRTTEGLTVFHDDGLYIAVTKNNAVALVEQDNTSSVWTLVYEPTDLVDLGRYLATLPEPAPALVTTSTTETTAVTETKAIKA